MQSRTKVGLVVAVAALAVMILLLVAGPALAGNGPGEPEPGTVQGITSYSAYSSVVTGSQTTLNSVSRRTSAWHSADIFVSVDVGASAAITITPQLSWNNADWVDAQYTYLTTTTPLEAVYRFIVSADGNDYIRMPLAGEYLRFSVTYTGPVTSTIGVTLRND